jgi:phosphoglycolate phosphatase
MSSKPTVSLLITDLDNTLFDWLETWQRSFAFVMAELSGALGIDPATFVSESRRIFKTHGTSEYRFLVREIGALMSSKSPRDVTEQFSQVIASCLKIRDETASLYPGVAETLGLIRASGCATAAYTESLRYYALRVVSETGLDGLLTAIYALPDHQFPEDLTHDELAIYGGREPHLSITQCRAAFPDARKPQPEILSRIMKDFHANAKETAYIGDGLMKDVLMAKRAGVIGVWARYGDRRDSQEYDLLRSVSYWTDEEIKRERNTTRKEASPRYSVSSFSELVNLFTFQPLK